MKERLEILDFKDKVCFFTFLFFLIIGFLVPIYGDDISAFISSNINVNNNNGSIISDYLWYLFVGNKKIFNIIFAIMMASFVNNSNNLLGIVKNKYNYLISFLGVLVVSTLMFSFNYTTIKYSVLYTFPCIVLFNYFARLFKKDGLRFSVLEIIFKCLIAIYMSLSNFIFAIIFVLGNIIYIFKVRPPKRYLFTLLVSIFTNTKKLSLI